jgi:hypothetical protein
MSSKCSPFSKSVDDAIKKYIDIISEKYNINKEDLLEIWKNQSCTDSNISDNDFEKLSRDQLVELCKSKGLKYSGTKKILISYLNGTVDGSSTKKAVCVKKEVKSVKTEEKSPLVIKKIISKIPTIPIHRNSFGNFEHSETSLVFNNKTQQVIGKQNSNGKIDDLSSDDIDICNKYKFTYVVPENMDKNDSKLNTEKEKIDELEDEKTAIDVDIDEDVLEEDEEEIEDEVEIEDDYEDEYVDEDY